MKKILFLSTILVLSLLIAACVPPEVADEADMSAEEAAVVAESSEGERAADEAADEAEKAAEEAADDAEKAAKDAEKAAEDAADEAEKAVEEAADAFEKALRNFEDLDANASQADVDQAFAEFESASEELLAVAAAEGGDVDGLEQALDELEQQIQSSMASGEPLEFQKDFLSEFFN